MRRTQADRQAEAARAQQITEQAQQRVRLLELEKFYNSQEAFDCKNPKEAFDAIMNTPKVLASLKRLSIR